MNLMNSLALLRPEPPRLNLGSTEAIIGQVPFAPNVDPEDRRQPGISVEMAGILDEVRHAMGGGDAQGAHAVALRLVTLLMPTGAAEFAGTRGGLLPWQKRKIDRYLREHLEQPLYLDVLAEQISLSASHFCRAFKKSYGTTPHMHIIELRLELAQRLMLSTEDSLSRIALTCGLADQSHLSRLFRRGVGESPGAWRRRYLSDAEADARSRRSKACRSAGLPKSTR
jgi:AraC family transcriptional regulator